MYLRFFEETVFRLQLVKAFALSTDEYQFMILVHDHGQIPNEYLCLFSETTIYIFRTCLHLFYQMQMNMNKGN